MPDPIRVAVIGDTHMPRGSRALPEECLRRLRLVDLILHAGDHSSAASLEALRALGPRVEAVHGNADDQELRSLLPRNHIVDAAGASIGMTHIPGPKLGREERLLLRFPGCTAIVYGHTHIPQVERVGDVWILNPGSPTERRRANERTMLELTVERGQATRPQLIALP